MAAELPNPLGCADYAANKTGGDAACDAAIAKETDPKLKSVMLFRRAYMEDAAGDFKTYPKALADLDGAIGLWPENTSALHERGYLYNEFGRWKDAEADISAQIALLPSDPNGYQERALARFNLGNLRGMFEDRDEQVLLSPNSASYLARADADVWLGNFDAARNDLAKAVQLARPDEARKVSDAADKARAELALWVQTSANAAAACNAADRTGDFAHETLIGDCTRAFLDAPTNGAKAAALTTRATAWLVLKANKEASAGDSIVAAGMDPTAGNLSNLATAAVWVFDRSIALEPSFANFAGRATARFNIGDYSGAFADAKKSFELRPNDIALTVLGDLAYQQSNSYEKAKSYWIAAYRLGDRDDGLIARLKEAGVPIPPPDDAAPAKAR
jgi:tetratricopeptide (TPR) repeat protein